MSRVASRRVGQTVLVGLLAVALAGTTFASAAQLRLEGRRPFAMTASRCQNGTVAVTAATTVTTTSAVTVSGLSGACVGKSVLVEVYDPASGGAWATAVVATATGTVAASPQVLGTAAAFTPRATLAARVLVGGWPLPTTWSYTPAVTTQCTALTSAGVAAPGGSCTITGVSMATPWGAAGHRQTNGHVSVVSTSSYVSFSVDLRSALPADWAWATAGTRSLPHYSTSGFACSSLPVLVGRTNPAWGNVDLYVELFENRTDAAPLNCTP